MSAGSARGARRAGATLALLAAAALAAGCGEWRRYLYEGFGRDAWQQPDAVVAALALRPGDRVADLGSGGGYFTFRLAEAVGPDGRVYAVDVDEDLNAYVAREAGRRGLGNVRVILAAPDDPRLPPDGVDLVFTSNTYHHLSERPEYFRRVRAHLRPGGRVAVVEFDGRHWLQRWLLRHYTPRDEIVREMVEAGYRLAAEHAFLDRQAFLVFEPAPAGGRP